jgi:RNA polymerase sigma factor (sigma-70 family)
MYERHTDAELLRLAPDDSVAFRVLYERHASTMEKWIYAQVRDQATARELLEETWASAWMECEQFCDESECPGAGAEWLYRIARRLIGQYRRQGVVTDTRSYLEMQSVMADDGELDDVPRRMDAQKLGPGVREAFEKLSPDEQEAIGLHVIKEMTYEETANHLRIGQTTARDRVRRALDKLRKMIDKGTTR